MFHRRAVERDKFFWVPEQNTGNSVFWYKPSGWAQCVLTNEVEAFF